MGIFLEKVIRSKNTTNQCLGFVRMMKFALGASQNARSLIDSFGELKHDERKSAAWQGTKTKEEKWVVIIFPSRLFCSLTTRWDWIEVSPSRLLLGTNRELHPPAVARFPFCYDVSGIYLFSILEVCQTRAFAQDNLPVNVWIQLLPMLIEFLPTPTSN